MLGEVLRRFRIGGVPGAPSSAGVPVDRVTELEDELAPVFEALAATQAQAAVLDAQAHERASRARAAGAERAAAIVAEARARASAEAAAAAADRRAIADDTRLAVLRAGELEAERVERSARERSPSLVDEIVGRILR